MARLLAVVVFLVSNLGLWAGDQPTWPPPSPAGVVSLLRGAPPQSPVPSLPPSKAISPTPPPPPAAFSGRFDSAPDWSKTPGVMCSRRDKDYTEDRYPEGIPYCRRNLTTEEKKEVSRRYNLPWEEHSAYQFDHLLSLCLGGSNDLRNIWPMPYEDARAKAKLESALCIRLKNGEITQAEAVRTELGWFADGLFKRAGT